MPSGQATLSVMSTSTTASSSSSSTNAGPRALSTSMSLPILPQMSSASELSYTGAVVGGESAPAATFSQKVMASQMNGYEEDQLWEAICARVLPLFNGDGLNGNIEELNGLVNRYLEQQLYGTILEELKSLLKRGCTSLLRKFDDTPADAFFPRLIEIWTFYFSVVLPYFQAAFLPLQLEIKGSKLVSSVRILALQAYRDNVVYVLTDKIASTSKLVAKELESSRAAALDKPAGRLLQMLLVLGDLRQKVAPGATSSNGEALSPDVVLKQTTELVKAAVRKRRIGQEAWQ
ncbi:hypothetical protein RI367_000582 [Sorochytrium milnesiophthora]